MALGQPQRSLAHGFAQHPVADRDDEAGFLGHRDEASGRDLAQFGVVPADQRLGAGDLTAGHVDLRLVVQAEVAPHQRLAHGVVDLHACQQVDVHLALVEAQRGAAMLLDPVHGVVGVLDQLGHGGTVLRVHRDADAAGDDEVHVLALKRCRQHVQNALAHELTGAHVGLVQDHDELVAAQARHGVVGAQALLDPVRHLHQHHVAKAVAQRVVDVLEAVQVDEHHGKGAVVALGNCNRLFHPLVQHDAVGQAGERVAVGQVVDATLVGQGLGQVVGMAYAVHGPAVFARHVHQ